MKRALSIMCSLVFLLSACLFAPGVRGEKQEVRACWVASVGNLDFPSDMGLSADALKAEINDIVWNCNKMGLNTIFFQVRPMGDALYSSKIFPWSVYLSGTQGVAPKENFDPLDYFVQAAHRHGIELHAWVNPYRIGTGADVMAKLSADNPAKLHPEYTVQTAEGLYYDPGLPQARQLILDGIKEIVENYQVDGIHFDDYFYPYNCTDFDDGDTYAQYGAGMSLDDFRRNSVDLLVQKAGKTVRSGRKGCQFGISPFGIWANRSGNNGGSDTSGMSSYSAIYSDSKKWVEEGWLDYICPQLYWSFDHTAAPFGVLVDWWDRLCAKNDMPLYIGIALYKVGGEEVGFSDGSLMEQQLQYISKKKSYAGHCFFRYGAMLENPKGATDAVLNYYKETPIADETEGSIEIWPSASNVAFPQISLQKAEKLSITSPTKGTTVSDRGISVTGTAPVGNEVLVNGIRATVNSVGLFAAYVPLKMGTNTITVTAMGQQKSVVVTRVSPQEITTLSDPYPTGEILAGAGEVIEFSVKAPAGASVVLKNEQLEIPLKANEQAPTDYKGMWTVPVLPDGPAIELNGFSYTAVYNAETIELATDLQLNLQKECRERQILQTDAYQFNASDGGSQMDHDPLRQGTAVFVCAREGTRARLENGYWVEQSVLGEKVIRPSAPLDYQYESLTISCDDPFSYITAFEENCLQLSLTSGQREGFDLDAESGDLVYELERGIQESVLTVSSRSGRTIAGYEIYPQKNRITVHLWFYSTGLQGKTIVLDSGHGGDDVGALSPGGTGYPSESDLNLALCDYLSQGLKNAGAKVVLLAAGTESLPLDTRVELAKKASPDLFLSVHHNSTNQTADFNGASGGMVLYSSPVSQALAQYLSGAGEQPMVCKRQSLRVCRQTAFPAVMLEVGYVCNPVEYETLCNRDIAQQFAENIIMRINDYFVTACS